NDGPLPPYGARTCGAGSETPPAPHIPMPGGDVKSFLLTLYGSAMYYLYHSARFEPVPLPGTNPGGGRKLFRRKTRLSCPGGLESLDSLYRKSASIMVQSRCSAKRA